VKTLVQPVASILVAVNRNKGWSVLRDGYCGNIFYFNRKTQESQWEKPKELMTVEEQSHRNLWNSTSVSIKKAFEKFKLLKLKAALRKFDWVQLVDDETNCIYWHNRTTFQNQWDPPKLNELSQMATLVVKSAQETAKEIAKEISEELNIEFDKVMDLTSVDAEDIPQDSVVRFEWLDYERQQTERLQEMLDHLDSEIEAAQSETSASSMLQMLDEMLADDDDSSEHAKGLMEEIEEIESNSQKNAKTLHGAMEQERQRQLGRLLVRVRSKAKRLANSKVRHAHLTDLRSLFQFMRISSHSLRQHRVK